MTRSSTNTPSQRMLRVGEQIKHVIAETLARGHFHEPALLDAGVTVTEVKVTPDLKHAYAYVLSLGGRNMEEILPALNNEAYTFQKEVSRGTQLKFTPKLQFRKDESFDKATHLEGIIRSIEYSDKEE
jgi:ribosome-binding factor A